LKETGQGLEYISGEPDGKKNGSGNGSVKN